MQMLLLLSLVPGSAQAAYTLSPVIVDGRPALLVTTISASGTIGGTFEGRTGAVEGFTRDPAGGLTLLAPGPEAIAGQQVPVPTSINDKGIVAGIASGIAGNPGFVARLGKLAAAFASSSTPGLPGQPLLMEINHRGTVAYNSYVGSGLYTGLIGQSGDIRRIEPRCSFPRVVSINKAGTVAGTCQPYQPAIFTQTDGVTTTIAGPGGTDAFGGYINDHGQVAGTYRERNGSLHGFVVRNGIYARFDTPFATTAMAVSAFSNTGIVAGTYTDATGAFHGFAWHDGQF